MRIKNLQLPANLYMNVTNIRLSLNKKQAKMNACGIFQFIYKLQEQVKLFCENLRLDNLCDVVETGQKHHIVLLGLQLFCFLGWVQVTFMHPVFGNSLNCTVIKSALSCMDSILQQSKFQKHSSIYRKSWSTSSQLS